MLAHPDQRLRTADARAVLPREVSLELALHQAAQIAAMVAALAAGDFALLGRALDDRIASRRGRRSSRLSRGEGGGARGRSDRRLALGQWSNVVRAHRWRRTATRVAAAMRRAYEKLRIPCTVRVERVDERGAWVGAA